VAFNTFGGIRTLLLTLTPFHMAVSMGRADMIELLISRGADVNRQDDFWKDTPELCTEGRSTRWLTFFARMAGCDGDRMYGVVTISPILAHSEPLSTRAVKGELDAFTALFYQADAYLGNFVGRNNEQVDRRDWAAEEAMG
jgi:hypothetical protein